MNRFFEFEHYLYKVTNSAHDVVVAIVKDIGFVTNNYRIIEDISEMKCKKNIIPYRYDMNDNS